MKVYVAIGLFFLHKRIKVFGKENIPVKGAILFIGNHQNALIDGLLIPVTTKRKLHFLSRASAFKNSIASTLLKSLNMIPIYRIRDGIHTIHKNTEVFENCFEILNNGNAIQIFAEGEHHLKRKILPLKKGFARIVLGTLQKYPDLKIQIVPVGFNYDSHLNFPCSVSIYYGEPILANNFINLDNPDLTFNELKNVVSSALKKVTLHIGNEHQYDTVIEKLDAINVDYLNPTEATQLVKNIDSIAILPKQKKKINWLVPIHFLAKLNSIFPLLIWRYIKSMIKDEIFFNTFRFAVILTLFPLFYLIQTGIVYYLFNIKYALVYLVSCIILGIISTKTMTVNQ